jgi:hypothetical protein
VKLHLLAVAAGGAWTRCGWPPSAPAGRSCRQENAARWAEAAAELLNGAAESNLRRETVAVTFTGDLEALPARQVCAVEPHLAQAAGGVSWQRHPRLPKPVRLRRRSRARWPPCGRSAKAASPRQRSG